MNRFALLGHYALTLYRSLTRHRLYAALNVLGLAVGIAVFLVLFLYVRFETSFERWIPNASQIAVIRTSWVGPKASLGGNYETMGGLLEDLRAEFPQTVGTRIRLVRGAVINGATSTPETFEKVDPTFFKVFDIGLIAGYKATLLGAPDDLVLTQAKAKQYFGAANPIGRRIALALDGAPQVYRVAGVLKDPPKSTDLKLDFLLSLKVPTSADDPWWRHWGSEHLQTFLRFRGPGDARGLDTQLDGFIDRHGRHDLGPDAHKTFRLRTYPLLSMHLHDARDLNPKDAVLVAALGLVGLLTLLLAGVNYVNLATARAGQRAREVALRKVMGATTATLIAQVLSEAVLTAALGVLLGVALCELTLPMVNAAGGLSLKLDILADPALLAVILVTVAVIGLGAGLYPAMVLSRFQPAAVLAAAQSPGGGRTGRGVREALVVLQFTIAIAFTIATGVIVAQTDYIRHADLGFRRDGLIVVTSLDDSRIDAAQRASLITAWRALPHVIAAATGQIAPGFQDTDNWDSYKRPGQAGDGPTLGEVSVGPDFFQTYGAHLLAGRFPDPAHGEDFISPPQGSPSAADAPRPIRNIVVNATAVRALGFSGPDAAIGQIVLDGEKTRRIIGVVEDLRFLSPKVPVRATAYFGDRTDFFSSAAGVRYAAADSRTVMEAMETAWRRIAPTVPFQARTIEQNLDKYYAQDDHQGHLFTLSAVLAVMIGCLGLYGLAAFNTSRRVREIGIRKTLGAATADILKLLVGQFLRPVLLANLIAWPLAWLAMRNWLGGFDQRITLGPIYFLAATALTLVIAVATVAGQAFAVARAEPAKALRHE
jgi:putative ABC transport system permease protein